MFKKIIATVLVIGAVLGISYYEHNYINKDCEITQVNDGFVTFIDKQGNAWDWEIQENEYFEIGDYVDLKMNDNNSSNNIEDDKITKIIFHD